MRINENNDFIDPRQGLWEGIWLKAHGPLDNTEAVGRPCGVGTASIGDLDLQKLTN